ncbi:acyltransferase family protein [Acidisoma sp.]|uniref:acyltransferase family protein n=1 Tax=Acidisoma sp. TaxID=1872115 RepID=UPI003AFF7977
MMEDNVWRRRDLDRGKTLAILLVVFGHIVAREDPSGGGWGAAWYEPARAAVYSFHIPFLFYLSGYAAHWSGATAACGPAYGNLLRRRAKRLLVPALVFGVAILVGKIAMMDELHVDHAPASFVSGLVDLVWRTDRSPAQSVWYIIVLFFYAAGAPMLLPLLRRYGPALLVVSAPLALLPVPPILYADRIVTYVPFFLAGMVVADRDLAWCRWLDAWRVPLAVLFALALCVDLRAGAAVPRNLAMLGVSIVALPALHAIVRQLPYAARRLLDWLGAYAFAIYLLNTIFIGLAKALLMKQIPWEADWFPLFAAGLMAAGVAGPILAKTLLFRPVPVLDRLTR